MSEQAESSRQGARQDAHLQNPENEIPKLQLLAGSGVFQGCSELSRHELDVDFTMRTSQLVEDWSNGILYIQLTTDAGENIAATTTEGLQELTKQELARALIQEKISSVAASQQLGDALTCYSNCLDEIELLQTTQDATPTPRASTPAPATRLPFSFTSPHDHFRSTTTLPRAHYPTT